MMPRYTNKIYARSVGGIIVKLFSSVFASPQEGDFLIEEGNEDCHAHVHLKYQLMDEQGRYNYKIVNGKFADIPEAEKPPIPVPSKSEIEILKETVDTLVLSQLGVL